MIAFFICLSQLSWAFQLCLIHSCEDISTKDSGTRRRGKRLFVQCTNIAFQAPSDFFPHTVKSRYYSSAPHWGTVWWVHPWGSVWGWRRSSSLTSAKRFYVASTRLRVLWTSKFSESSWSRRWWADMSWMIAILFCWKQTKPVSSEHLRGDTQACCTRTGICHVFCETKPYRVMKTIAQIFTDVLFQTKNCCRIKGRFFDLFFFNANLCFTHWDPKSITSKFIVQNLGHGLLGRLR